MKKTPLHPSLAGLGLAAFLLCASAQSQSQSGLAAQPQRQEQRVALAIAQRKIAPKPPTIRVRQGDNITLDWTTDEIVSIHLHGYDQLLTVKPGETKAMRIDAAVPGRFPVSAHGYGPQTEGKGKQHKHHREAPLMYLEVLPR
jgi:FtsP/CotA-like multicopper oxidase with cupredoxin domain